jgi:hypothetical protein
MDSVGCSENMALLPNRLFDADAQALRRFAACLPRAGQLRRYAAE